MGDLAIVLRSLRTRALSTTVTAAMVAVACAILLVLLSMRSAAHAAFRRGTGNIHLLVSADSSPLEAVLNGLFYANPPRAPISQERFEKLKASYPWEWCIPTQIGDSFRGWPVVATTEAFIAKVEPSVGEPFVIAEGRNFERADEAVVGSECARANGIAIGDDLILTHGAWSGHGGDDHDEHPTRVVGILAPTGSPHDRALFTDIRGSWEMHGAEGVEHADHGDHAGEDDHADEGDHADEAERPVTGVLLRLPTRAGSSASAAIQERFDILRRESGITVAMPADQVDRLFRIIGDIDGLFIALSIGVMVSSSLGILLALYNSMDLRRRQVAVLRVLGATRGRVFSLVISEAAIIGAIGAVAGILLAQGGAMVAADELRRRVGLVLDPQADMRTVALVAIGAILLSSLAGIIPAMRAYRTPIAPNLKPLC